MPRGKGDNEMRGRIVLGLVSLATSFVAMPSFGVTLSCTQHEIIFRGGGGGYDVPTPFDYVARMDGANRRFELAENEIYDLIGRVVLLPAQEDDSGNIYPYLEIDLNHFGLLANSKRLSSPYYRLEGSAHDWKRWDRLPVRILVYARSHIIMGRKGLQNLISLDPFLNQSLR